MKRLGAAGFQIILVIVLVLGVAVVAYFIGYATAEEGPKRDSASLDRSRAYAFVQVEPRQLGGLLNDDRSVDWTGVQIIQRSQAVLLTHSGLIARVLSNPNSRIRQRTEWFKSMKDPIKARRWLTEHLVATAVPESALIRVSLDTPIGRKDEATIIEEIVQQHLDDQKNNSQNRVQDRTQALNNLRIRYETRIRELQDRQQNRMLMLDIGQIGSPNRYTATDVELQELMKKRAELIVQGATIDPSTQPSDPASRGLVAVDARIEQLKQKLGDLAIAMSDYLSISDELATTREDLKRIKQQLDSLSSGAVQAPVVWAQRPVASDEPD